MTKTKDVAKATSSLKIDPKVNTPSSFIEEIMITRISSLYLRFILIFILIEK